MASEAPIRAPRSDARENRKRVLVAARECFAESLDAQMQDIARRAGTNEANEPSMAKATLEGGPSSLGGLSTAESCIRCANTRRPARGVSVF